MADLGKQGPHPDVLDVVVDAYNRATSSSVEPISAEDLRLLQQRTLYGVRAPISRRPEDVSDVAVTVGLATMTVTTAEGDASGLLLFEAVRVSGEEDWGFAGMTSGPTGDPPLKPLTALAFVSPKSGLAYGAKVNSPDIARVRIALANGTMAEDTVSDGSLLLFLPFNNSPSAWSAHAMVRLYDSHGREIVSEPIDVGLEPPKGIQRPRPQNPPRRQS